MVPAKSEEASTGFPGGLLSWDQLPDSQKDKDRALVTSIPAILGQCGYAVIPVPE